MYPDKYIRNAFVAATAVLFVGTTVLPDRQTSGPINGASVEAVAAAPTLLAKLRRPLMPRLPRSARSSAP